MKLKGSQMSYNQKIVSRGNALQNIWDSLSFSLEREYDGKSFTAIFKDFFASINKAFIWPWGLVSRLSFHDV